MNKEKKSIFSKFVNKLDNLLKTKSKENCCCSNKSDKNNKSCCK